jgi:CheY-like chemotaxis protein
MKVLVVDDDDDIRRIASASLRMVGRFETLVAASAPEGIDLAKRERPDLILMDMMMPKMDGLAALAELRRSPELDHVPVMFLTAKVQRSEVDHYLACGAAGVIQKPFDPMTLPDQIRRLLSE